MKHWQIIRRGKYRNTRTDGQIDRQTLVPFRRVPPLVSRYRPSASAVRERELPPEPWHGKGIAEEVPQYLFKHHFTKKCGERVDTSVFS